MGRNKSFDDREYIHLSTFGVNGSSDIGREKNLFEKYTMSMTFILFLVSFLFLILDYEYTQYSLHGPVINEILAYTTLLCITCSLIVIINKRLLGFSLLFFNLFNFALVLGYVLIGFD